MIVPTASDLIGGGACFVEMWGAGYLVIALIRARRRRNQQPLGEELSC